MATGSGLTGNSSINLALKYQDSLDLSIPIAELNINTGINWTYGSGANQANVVFSDSRSTDLTGETHNVYSGGSLLDIFGNALTMEAIKLLYLKNTHASLVLEVFGNTSLDLLIMESTADAVLIPAGGSFLWQCPTAAGIVTTTNFKLFIAAASTGTITYDIVMLGND